MILLTVAMFEWSPWILLIVVIGLSNPLLSIPDASAIFLNTAQHHERNRGSDADIEPVHSRLSLTSLAQHASPTTVFQDVHGSTTKSMQKVIKALLDHRSVWDILHRDRD